MAVRYQVTATLANEEALQEYLDWLKGGHVQAVVAGGAVSGEVFRHDGDELKITSSYVFPSREAFRTYEETVAPGLRADGVQRFSATGKAVAFQRALGEIAFQA